MPSSKSKQTEILKGRDLHFRSTNTLYFKAQPSHCGCFCSKQKQWQQQADDALLKVQCLCYGKSIEILVESDRDHCRHYSAKGRQSSKGRGQWWVEYLKMFSLRAGHCNTKAWQGVYYCLFAKCRGCKREYNINPPPPPSFFILLTAAIIITMVRLKCCPRSCCMI